MGTRAVNLVPILPSNWAGSLDFSEVLHPTVPFAYREKTLSRAEMF
jgi:hypothetical protein